MISSLHELRPEEHVMSDHYYSLSYAAVDYKVVQNQLSYSGVLLDVRPVANFALFAAVIEDSDKARVIAEKLAREFADKLNAAYLQGWKDSSDTAERDDPSYWESQAAHTE
jgi:hypothetical protein